ncbi:MAG: hemL [Chlamydiales bacterium]|jgi:glutamate-1-semialdehyde 2,1-aminomutase|nr:hemL [Chlamydiales bacterium]
MFIAEQTRTQSALDYNLLSEVIPGGVNSPIRAFQALDMMPMVALKGMGDLIVDVDHNQYIDYCMSWGTLIHGHVHPLVTEEIVKGALEGTTFGVTTPFEGRLAQKMVSLVESLEQVRFVSSGTEATMSAVRLARGYTQKKWVLKFDGNYHGHADQFLVRAGSAVQGLQESSSQGIQAESIRYTLSIPYNDIEALDRALSQSEVASDLAAIIVEPVAANMGVVPGDPLFLKRLREWADRLDALLIFDEVISGFRVGLQGAQGAYGIRPDLSCYGKIIGGGLPAAAFGGRREVMSYLAPLGPVFQAGTLSGNPLAMRAGLKALELLEQPQFYQKLEAKADLLLNPIEELILEENLSVALNRFSSLFTLFFGVKKVRNVTDIKGCQEHLFRSFFASLFSQGIFAPPAQNEAWFLSMAHEEAHLEKTRDAILQFLKENRRLLQLD